MKSFNTGEVTGTIRAIDEAGRITLPIEHRKELDINSGDKVEIFNLRDGFYIKKIEK